MNKGWEPVSDRRGAGGRVKAGRSKLVPSTTYSLVKFLLICKPSKIYRNSLLFTGPVGYIPSDT